MNQKWMKRDGQKWVDEKIITSEQLDLLVARYPNTIEQNKPSRVLPILASILIGIGILSFIASNWGEIPPLARLALLLVIMTGFYTAGEVFAKKGNNSLSTSFNFLGIISFGASIILLGQTFHLSAVDAQLFVFWSLPAIYYLFRDRKKIFFLLLAVITIGGQLYSISNYENFSYLLFLVFLVSIGGYLFLYPRRLEANLFTIGLSAQVLMFLLTEEINFLWFFLFGLALYTAGLWVEKSVFKQAFNRIGTLIGFAFAYGLYLSMTNEFFSDFDLPKTALYLPGFLILFAAALYAKRSESLYMHFWELLIFVPFFYLMKVADPLFVGLLYLIVMFTYSGLMLAKGFKNENRQQINLGIVLFMLVCLMGYFNLAWAFMPKSIFFLLGGILLFILNAFLQRKKKQILKNGGPHNE
ncbi:DUF2157 domain-containing protein [Bacillus sp. NEB1478]|uniref:DUF2157 domain-containing protein n=1 Tax=Bacillus sp. NEB1478 TaxID=3073816 RepID=UPI00287364AF|nr:DUF2157 domain-containing protein [Bacillus sp. NEB1478]WNB91478.1 DUF2157 domain-containing protein [Bacillus sp. NEB1478]